MEQKQEKAVDTHPLLRETRKKITGSSLVTKAWKARSSPQGQSWAGPAWNPACAALCSLSSGSPGRWKAESGMSEGFILREPSFQRCAASCSEKLGVSTPRVDVKAGFPASLSWSRLSPSEGPQGTASLLPCLTCPHPTSIRTDEYISESSFTRQVMHKNPGIL